LGFNSEVQDMDVAVGKLSKDAPTVLITASYEGEPPDNALQFV
jgi:cytochrome P450/NADPH-cytochrome P450 reductase